MNRKQHVRVVAFDFGGTLFRQPSRREIAARLQIPALRRLGHPMSWTRFHMLSKQTDHIIRHYPHPKDLEEGLWPTIFFHLLGAKITKQQAQAWDKAFWGFLLVHTTLMPGALNILRHLRRKGVKIAFVTNSTIKSARFKIRRFGLAKYADILIISESIGHKKSTLDPFAALLKEAGVRPEEILMIGNDAVEDLCARRLGIRTVLLSSSLSAKSHHRPDYVISKLTEIKKFV